MVIKRSIVLSCSPETCLSHVKTSRLLTYVSWPIICFEAVEPEALPEVWEQKKYVVNIKVFCFIPFGRQNINISARDRSKEKGKIYLELRDNGSSKLISKWDHVITITSERSECLYSDLVEIKAGFLTPAIVVFAWFFYRHRQNRWKKLVENEFDYK